MKSALPKVFVFTMIVFSHSISAQAQWYRSLRLMPSPAPSLDAYISQPGITLTQVLDTIHALLDPSDTGEGGSLDQFEAHKIFWQSRVVQNDSSGHNMFERYYNALRLAVAERSTSSCVGAGNWNAVGPDNMPTQTVGYTNAVWGDPNDSNHILVGSMYSGLFETHNGGANWNCITDNAPLVGGVFGIESIAVNPLNTNTIFLGTGGFATEGGAGILESYNGGSTWQQEFIPIYGDYRDTIQIVQGVFFTPDSSRIYAFIGNLVYTRTNHPVGTWQNITPTGTYVHWTDLQFVPGNQNHFFISNTDYTSVVMQSGAAVPASGDWNNITSALTATIGGAFVAATDWGIMKISMPESDTLFIFAMANSQLANLYKYSVSGASITLVYDNLPGMGIGYSRGKGQLAVTPIESNNGYRRNIYYGRDIPYHSFDGGQSFYEIGAYGCKSLIKLCSGSRPTITTEA